MKNSNKLDQLTALRFFAALMIVIHHSVGLFGAKDIGVNWGQGVSFFFVLSGFILTYVYPSLETWPQIRRFWKARVARIWPAYLVSFAIGYLLIPYVWVTKIALVNLLMLQSLVPLSTYYFSYNALSWSVSTEAFFYLMFPFLLYKWNSYWKIKILFSGALLIFIIYISDYLKLPDYGNPGIGSNGLVITQHGLIYINPLSRIFEFITGMVIATFWRRRNWLEPSAWATFYEIGAILACALSMYFGNDMAQWGRRSPLGDAAALWIIQSSSCFAFGLLIYVMAQGRGKISAILSAPFFVLLGEISFSLYLIHQILLATYGEKISSLEYIPKSLTFFVFISILLLASYVMWAWIEMPARRLLMGGKPIHGTPTMVASWHDHVPKKYKPIIAFIGLLCLILFTQFSAKLPVPTIDEAMAEALTPLRMKSYLGADFQGFVRLRGLNIQCSSSNLDIKLAWEKIGFREDRLTNAVHLINTAGKILEQADYKQPESITKLKLGDIWLDKLVIPSSKIKSGATSLAIGIYDAAGNLLFIKNAKTDWGGRRMIVNFDRCPKVQP